MQSNEAVRTIMKEQGVGLTKLSERMDKGVSVISERLRQSNISVKNLREILRALDYRIVIIPRDVSIPKGGYEIE